MLVTSFRLKKIENPTNRLVAKCTLTFDAMLAVSDIKAKRGKIYKRGHLGYQGNCALHNCP